MGRDVARAWPSAARLLESVAPGLHGTELVQPALTAVALGAASVLRDAGVPCQVTAGHSVGELAAWAVAGGIAFDQAIDLARARGDAMAAAARDQPGGMWAFPAAPEPLPEGLQVAVYNPGQCVLSGPGPCPTGRPVPTSGAWHSPAMEAARAPFAAALEAVPRQPLALPVVSNRDGSIVRDDDAFRAHLLGQLTHAVHWESVLVTLRASGVTDLVILGPSKVLTAPLRTFWPEVRVHRTDRARDLRATVTALR
ncbi:MAG: ACP S-malonyltransferase [Proteobacteria bacterium]|nr:ACP S-malonyltransferase [Pseudomonadota bacterium]